MKKPFPIAGVLLFTIVVGVVGYELGIHAREPAPEAKPTLVLPTPGPYLALIPQDCQNTDTADATACVWSYASSTAHEADMLAKGLVSADLGQPEAAVPGYPIFGGADFSSDLSIGVRKAEQRRQSYIDTICKLDSMMLYGGSGIDLEQGACEYYYEALYLDILKGLQGEATSN